MTTPYETAQATAIQNAVTLASASLSAANTFTPPITVTNSDFAISITGTFVGTISLQVAPVWRDVPEPAWVDAATYTGPAAAQSRVLVETWLVRAGFETGNYTSGTAVVSINAGEQQNQRFS